MKANRNIMVLFIKNHLAIIILTNSSQLMCPSPSMSASLIISSTSSSVSFSPKFVITCLSSAAEINPFPSLSKTLNASISYSSVSVSFIFLAMRERNSGKSMVPFPSASTSLIISWSSASVGFCPNDLMTVPSYLVVMEPSPFLSKSAKASLNSAICYSFNWSAMFFFEKLNIYKYNYIFERFIVENEIIKKNGKIIYAIR